MCLITKQRPMIYAFFRGVTERFLSKPLKMSHNTATVLCYRAQGVRWDGGAFIDFESDVVVR